MCRWEPSGIGMADALLFDEQGPVGARRADARDHTNRPLTRPIWAADPRGSRRDLQPGTAEARHRTPGAGCGAGRPGGFRISRRRPTRGRRRSRGRARWRRRGPPRWSRRSPRRPRRRRAAAGGRASRGSHQLASPISAIVAGTSTIRTTVASTSTATVRPTANILISTSGDQQERGEHADHDQGGRGDHPGGGGQAVDDAAGGCRRCARYSSRTRLSRNTS